MPGDLASPRLLYLKARLFLVVGGPSSARVLIVRAFLQTTGVVRGVVTREEVVRSSNQHYGMSMAGWFVGFPSVAAMRRLIHSLASLASVRRNRGGSDGGPREPEA